MRYAEINFDGLVGPTHNHAAWSSGNTASSSARGSVSSPRAAALQGLEKAKALADRGFPQAILPPHERPDIGALRTWGFHGHTDKEILTKAAKNPALLAAASSAAAMWTANACTTTPSCDAEDERVHITPANLYSDLHRSIEAPFTTALLKYIFADEERFIVHDPLAQGDAMADEGAANHMRLAGQQHADGLHVFTYGRSVLFPGPAKPRKFPARQTRESFEVIARRHQIPVRQCVFVQQSPAAIDAGAFQNNVIAAGTGSTLLVHSNAFVNQPDSLVKIKEAFGHVCDSPLCIIEVSPEQLSLTEAIRSYLFNSQLLERQADGILLLVPRECYQSETVSNLLDAFIADTQNPIHEVLAFDLKDSMRSGGGPACLRNPILLNKNEWRHIQGRVELDDTLFDDLISWIKRHYRESLSPDDLADPNLLEESQRALDELSTIMHLPSLYPFQR